MHLTTRPVAALIGLALGLALGGGCTVQSIYTCAEHQDCVDELGLGAQCESNNQCTVPDAGCASGRRWHERAVEELSGQCFDPSDLGGSGGASESSGAEASGSSDGGAGASTASPGETSADSGSSGDPPATTGAGSSGTGG